MSCFKWRAYAACLFRVLAFRNGLAPLLLVLPLVILLAVLFPATAHAFHLGTIGQVYPIGETNALVMIENKLRAMQGSGTFAAMQAESTDRAMHSITHMPPVEGIRIATRRVRRLIDPTVTYRKAIATDDGRIVVPAGTRINPLDIVHLSKTIVFFDGRDAGQREAVRKLVAADPTHVKPILVAGSWLDITKAWKTQVFYDQHGVLSRRFGIRAVPSVIRQQDKLLLLEEIPARDLR